MAATTCQSDGLSNVPRRQPAEIVFHLIDPKFESKVFFAKLGNQLLPEEDDVAAIQMAEKRKVGQVTSSWSRCVRTMDEDEDDKLVLPRPLGVRNLPLWHT